MPGTLFVVATPIGNLEDISARALRVLGEVAVIAAEDTRRTAHLLARYAIATPTTSLHEHNEAQKTPALVARLSQGDDVALVSDAGTPTVSDPGRRLIEAVQAAGLRVEPIPGPSAVMAALAVSGFPAESFTFMGFPPIRSKDRSGWFDRLVSVGGTIVFFEAPHRIIDTLHELKAHVGEKSILVCREMTKTHEELVKGQISDVLERGLELRGEFTVVAEIGQTTDRKTPDLTTDPKALLEELGRLIENGSLTRRQAVSRLARRYGLSPNYVYDAIETAKKSVN
jgi:16S rRNA (cytidine1402-2'-O)-methyltransferase